MDESETQKFTVRYELHDLHSLHEILPTLMKIPTDIPFEFQAPDFQERCARSVEQGDLKYLRYSLMVCHGNTDDGPIIAMIEELPSSDEGVVFVNAFEVLSPFRSNADQASRTTRPKFGTRIFSDYLDRTVNSRMDVELDCQPSLISFYRKVAETTIRTRCRFTVSAAPNPFGEHRITIGEQ